MTVNPQNPNAGINTNLDQLRASIQAKREEGRLDQLNKQVVELTAEVNAGRIAPDEADRQLQDLSEKINRLMQKKEMSPPPEKKVKLESGKAMANPAPADHQEELIEFTQNYVHNHFSNNPDKKNLLISPFLTALMVSPAFSGLIRSDTSKRTVLKALEILQSIDQHKFKGVYASKDKLKAMLDQLPSDLERFFEKRHTDNLHAELDKVLEEIGLPKTNGTDGPELEMMIIVGLMFMVEWKVPAKTTDTVKMPFNNDKNSELSYAVWPYQEGSIEAGYDSSGHNNCFLWYFDGGVALATPTKTPKYFQIAVLPDDHSDSAYEKTLKYVSTNWKDIANQLRAKENIDDSYEHVVIPCVKLDGSDELPSNFGNIRFADPSLLKPGEYESVEAKVYFSLSSNEEKAEVKVVQTVNVAIAMGCIGSDSEEETEAYKVYKFVMDRPGFLMYGGFPSDPQAEFLPHTIAAINTAKDIENASLAENPKPGSYKSTVKTSDRNDFERSVAASGGQ
ncbi:MAG: hypothetical protein P0S94_03920 [Simkaniaceae bacterium]|nr:hypothetical protein [Simkaniaceae bacterium]